MEFFDLMSISSRYMELFNPSTPEKILRLGKALGMKEGAFDIDTCIGATFVFGGYRETVRALKRAIRPGGRVGIGEVYWLSDNVPPEYALKEASAHPETELLRITREEGFEVESVSRASNDDWDVYSSSTWYALLRWLEENPASPDCQQVFERLRSSQDDYFRYVRQYLGWVMYVLAPATLSTAAV